MFKLLRLCSQRNKGSLSLLSFNCSSTKPEPKTEAYNSSQKSTNILKKDAKKHSLLPYLILGGFSSLILYNIYIVAEHEKYTPVYNEPGAIPGIINVSKFLYEQYSNAIEFLTKPPYRKLLPDVPKPELHPKTLVLRLSGTLLDIKKNGDKVYIVKRPGLQQFLRKMSKLYYIVIFEDYDYSYLSTIIPEIDPRGQFITECLGHECTLYVRGRRIKDLSYLNRNMNKIIAVDLDPKVLPRNKNNLVVLKQFYGDQNDRYLILLGRLLYNLASPKVKDVRYKLYELGDNPLKKFYYISKQGPYKKPYNIKRKRVDIFGFLPKK